jgi:hypothetical protein
MMSLIRATRMFRGRARWSALAATAVAGALLIARAPWDGGVAIAAQAQVAPTKAQAEALNTYNKALDEFRSVLKERREQIDQKQPLPDLPGQAIYLARNNMISTYKDLTDLLPSRIGKPNRFGLPPAYFDADNEPLLEEYFALFSVMQAPLPNAQNSGTPFRDVAELATDIARAKGLDTAHADVAARISMGIFFAETGGLQNMGNARSNVYKGSFQTGPSEDRNGQKKWAAIKPAIAPFDPALVARDDKEQARAAKHDQRFNHWTNVRNALMNEHADIFPQIPQIVKTLPNPIDQMKVFELIQIIPSPTKSALRSGDLINYRISTPRIMGYLRNNSMFAFGKADRAKTSATFREILDAMWLFNRKFEQAIAKFNEIKAQNKG